MRTLEHSTRLFDMHCHLGFVRDADAVRRCLQDDGIHALSCTVSPADYLQSMHDLANTASCTVALGLHPWQVASVAYGEAELARFEELAPTTRFIGEVGLDHAGERGAPTACEQQRSAFARVLEACDAPSPFPRKLLSIHAVHAASEVLKALEDHNAPVRHDCVFHWFSGTPEELKRAIGAGCFFSVGPRMLATKRGREFARIIPEDRLLLETDLPAREGDAWDCGAWIDALSGSLEAIARIRNARPDELAVAIAHTSAKLLKPS